jgi:hypothetical protein
VNKMFKCDENIAVKSKVEDETTGMHPNSFGCGEVGALNGRICTQYRYNPKSRYMRNIADTSKLAEPTKGYSDGLWIKRNRLSL